MQKRIQDELDSAMNLDRHPRLQRIPVYYTPAMVADGESFSPSASKPAEVMNSWMALGVPLAVHEPPPVSRDQLARAHDPAYVDDILGGRRENGFGNTSAAVASSLPWTSGAMLAAGREALRNRQVAVAPCSGFHHGAYEAAFGYCTFNGLMVTALALHDSGSVQRIGILDFDEHYGDGTDDIIERLGLDWIVHHTEGKVVHSSEESEGFIRDIPSIVSSMSRCDLILYQAGADPHVDDPLGGWLTTAQLLERDRLVFQSARALSVPVAWNLAGGYQTPLRRVLDIHDNTMRACEKAYRNT